MKIVNADLESYEIHTARLKILDDEKHNHQFCMTLFTLEIMRFEFM
jgi:hypothetical protein